MEFWGIEVKPGNPVKVEPEDGYIIHVSQVSLGEWQKEEKDVIVPVYVEVGGDKQKLVIGNLSQKVPQVSLDLYFEQEFELSHDCKTTSVFLLGYKTLDVMDEQDEEDYDSEEEGMPAMDFFEKGMNGEKAKTEATESDSDEEDESDSEDEDEEDEAPLLVEPPSKKANGGAMNKAVASKKAIQQKKGQKTGCQFPCGSSCKN